MVSLEHAQLLMPDVSENINIAVSNFIVIYPRNHQTINVIEVPVVPFNVLFTLNVLQACQFKI